MCQAHYLRYITVSFLLKNILISKEAAAVVSGRRNPA